MDEIDRVFREIYGEDAQFRDGQKEAIEATLTNRRTLVVQRTGWGKSLVYFICTRILRNRQKGLTLVVSPLLSLMDNQIEAAKNIGLKCGVLNSTTRDTRSIILSNIINNKLDIVFITPETLFAEDIQKNLKDIRIGLFVIDECHCISDWGHDFRLEYGNLNKIIKTLPFNVPILATTATANDRVIEDLQKQLGDEVYISRGPLMRKSLSIQVLHMPNIAERYAWILKNINKLPGTGIIYCLTCRDCDFLSEYLRQNGISAMAYYSKKNEDENNDILDKFYRNEIKVIVATIKLGMGYDKGDIGFVIHFQQPSNIVSYYQQIGRAGRKLDNAYVILMTGAEDEKIIDHFIDTAFPTRNECDIIMNIIENNNGVTKGFIQSNVNMKYKRMEKALYFLQNENAIFLDKGKFYPSLHKYYYNEEHYQEITAIRKKEKKQMLDLVNTKECYLKYIANCLDDFSAVPCGKCTNCVHHTLIGEDITDNDAQKAVEFINKQLIIIEPRIYWAITPETKNKKMEFVNNVGACLSRYGDVGYGHIVSEDKYDNHFFREVLIDRSQEVLQNLIQQNNITHITCVPSLRNDMVKNFTIRLAKKIGLVFMDTLDKDDAPQQKKMENSSHQCYNAYKSFHVKKGITIPYNFLLIDDIVDSRWTLTICGYRLMEQGAISVTPFALADSSQREDKN